MRSILSHQPGLSPACDHLGTSMVLGLVHTLLNFQLFQWKAQICYIWTLLYGSWGGTEVNRSKFVPWSSAVSVETPAEDCWDESSLDWTGCTPVLRRITNHAVFPLHVLCSPACREQICSSEALVALQPLFLQHPNRGSAVGWSLRAQPPLACGGQQMDNHIPGVLLMFRERLQTAGGTRGGSFWLASDRFTFVRP